MIRKSNVDLSQPAHQPIQALTVIFWKSFGGLIRSLWPLLIYFFLSSKSNNNWFLLIGSVGLALISFFFGLLRYYHFLYHVENDNLIISSGLFTKINKNIPFDRIQSIRLEQKFVHRLFNLYSVKVDTAGSSKEEIEIPALDHVTASKIKSLVESYTTSNQKRASRHADGEPVVDDELVFQLNVWEILKLGLTANHIRNFFIIIGILFGISSQLGTFDAKYRLDHWIDYALENQDSVGFEWYYLLSIPIALLISMLVSILFSLFTNYNLRVVKTKTGYQVNQGLVNRKEQIAPYKKIQVFRWVISPLRRILGLYNVSIKQASSSEISVKKSIRIPGATIQDVHRFLNRIFQGAQKESTKDYFLHEKFLFRYFTFFVVIPLAGLLIAWWWLHIEYLIVIGIVWGLLISLFLGYYYDRWKLTLGQEYLQVRKGVITTRRERIFIHKLQGLRLTQSPYQSRHNLANIELHTAAGNLSIPYLKLEQAQEISNYLMYKIESSRRAWM